MATNGKRGLIEVDLGDGITRKIRFTFNAIAEVEDHFGESITSVFSDEKKLKGLKAVDWVKLFGAGLRGGGESITDDEVGSIMVLSDIETYVGFLQQALGQSTTGKKGVPKADPQ